MDFDLLSGMRRHRHRFDRGPLTWPPFTPHSLEDAIAGVPGLLSAMFTGARGYVRTAFNVTVSRRLRNAIANQDLSALKSALRAGADPDRLDDHRWAAIHHVAASKDTQWAFDALSMLLGHGADPNMLAVVEARLLTPLKIVVGPDRMGPPHRDSAAVDGAVRSRPDILKLTQLLLEHGADPNVGGADTSVALTLAVRHVIADDVTGVVSLLLAHGADPRWQDPFTGWTALMLSAASGDIPTMTALLSACDDGIDINHAGNGGLGDRHSALTAAALDGQHAAIQLLLDHGADVDHATSDDATALMAAVRRNDVRTAKILLDGNATPNWFYYEEGRDLEAVRLAFTDVSISLALALAPLPGPRSSNVLCRPPARPL